MFKLTYVLNGALFTITAPSYWSLYHLRQAMPMARLWNKDGSLSF